VTGNLLHGWRVEEYGRSRDGVALRAFFPEGNSPTAGLLVAAQHGEEAVTALLARRLLERVSGDATRWVVVPVANPDGLINGTRQNAAGVDLNRNFPAATWRPEDSFTYPPGIEDERRVVANRTNLAPGEDVVEVERRLDKFTPDEFKRNAHHWLILHGRYVCVARKPKCPECIIRDLCEFRHKTPGQAPSLPLG